MDLVYNLSPNCCKNCINNPINNPRASGICNCALPSLELYSSTSQSSSKTYYASETNPMLRGDTNG